LTNQQKDALLSLQNVTCYQCDILTLVYICPIWLFICW